MRTSSAVVLDSGRRVQRFLDANGGALAAANGSAARKKLDQAVAALESNANELEAKTQQGVGETAKQRTLRLALLTLMRSINRVGRLFLADVPDFSPLRMPGQKVKLHVLLEKAYAMQQAAVPQAQVFIDGGLPADFLARLQAAIDAIAASTGDRTDVGSARVVATGGTLEQAVNVRKATRALDSLVQLALPVNDPLLGAWRSAKRLDALRSATKPASVPVSAPVTPAVTPDIHPAATLATSTAA